jgi:hemerythrin-like domain-containing protein
VLPLFDIEPLSQFSSSGSKKYIPKKKKLTMKRDPRLHRLSSDHHHGLVLARSLQTAVSQQTTNPELALQVSQQFSRDLEPHFQTEETILLPALRLAGEQAFAKRTMEDHDFLRKLAQEMSTGNVTNIAQFAERLVEHIRFEERELFPCCEKTLSDSVLDLLIH